MAFGVPAVEAARTSRSFSTLLTDQLRVLLEQGSVRSGAIGVMLVVASFFSLLPTPQEIDSGWMFMVPVAVAAVAGGLREGLLVAFAAAALCALYATAAAGALDENLVAGVVAARFALYGITAAVLGAFADTHYAVQSKFRELAAKDPLTNVANVAGFYQELNRLQARPERFALLVVDVDDLKSLNDRYGHQVGSAAIQTLANVLRRVVRSSDCVARFGGDEFVVILRDIDRIGAQIVINRINDILKQETLPRAPDGVLSASIGVAMWGEDGTSSEELLSAADSAMYADKRARKSATLALH